jgi:hypothetical protein
MIIYMGLLAIIMTILTSVFVSLVDLQLESQSTSVLEHDERYIISRLSYDIRRADSITTPAAIGGTGNTLVLSIGGTSYTYSVSGVELGLTRGAVYDRLNGADSEVPSVTFTRLGNAGGKNSIQVDITLRSRVFLNGEREEKTISTIIGIR